MTWLPTKLSCLLTLEYGKSLPRHSRVETGAIPVAGSNGSDGFHDTALVHGPGIVVGRKGSAGKVTWYQSDFWPIDTTYFVQHDPRITNIRWLYYLLQFQKLERLNKTTGVPGLNRNDAYAESCLLPPPKEQTRIVELLDEADRLRRLRREADAKAARILPALFLKMFSDPATNPMGWPITSFADTFDDTTSGSEKLQSRHFMKDGRIAVVDQGQSQIAGYTDDVSIAYRGKLPAILFGDHTRIFKFIDHPFVLGADGVRVLTPKPKVNPLFAYWHCKLLNIQSAGYSRHFKYLKEKSFICPDEALQKRFSVSSQTIMSQFSVLEVAAAKVEQMFSVVLEIAFSGQLTAQWRELHMQELLSEMTQQARAMNLSIPKELEVLP